jgi:hypothetical protein
MIAEQSMPTKLTSSYSNFCYRSERAYVHLQPRPVTQLLHVRANKLLHERSSGPKPPFLLRKGICALTAASSNPASTRKSKYALTGAFERVQNPPLLNQNSLCGHNKKSLVSRDEAFPYCCIAFDAGKRRITFVPSPTWLSIDRPYESP